VKPFRPFTIPTADGVTRRVGHPGLPMLTPGGTVVIGADGPDAVDVIDVPKITASERGNGRHRKRNGRSSR